MSELNIVLVEPEIPQNTGNIARTCAATGARLHIVKPMGFAIDDKKLKRAGLDYWYLLDLTYYENMDDFFEKNPDGNYFFFTTKAQHTHSDVTYTDKSFLIFGKETKGLPEELLLEHPEECVRIPMIDDARSLNLSNAVAIGTYEALRQMGYPTLQNKGQLHNYEW
jgi:tRNA (cytidine/uridine-2'-O-)-methyltransferase